MSLVNASGRLVNMGISFACFSINCMPTSSSTQAFDPAVYQEAEARGQHLLANQFLVALGRWPSRCCYVSRHAENVLGYAAGLIDADLLHRATHPDDLPFVLRAAGLAEEFAAYAQDRPGGPGPPPAPGRRPTISSSVDYRLRCRSGVFVRVLRQNFILAQDAAGHCLATGSIFTDITGHKTTPEVRFRLDHPDFLAWLHTRQSPAADANLSVREQEVLVRMLVGEPNADIAKELFISDLTLKTHRRNIHRKLRPDGDNDPLPVPKAAEPHRRN